jgi:poly(3-hydroxybutyrate) depolymerase
MKRYVTLLLLAWMLPGCPVPWTPETPVQAVKKTQFATGAKYYIYKPSYHTTDRTWPVIITLHGSFGWDGPMRQAHEWQYYAEKYGFILIAPSLSSAEGILPLLWWDSKLKEDETNVLAILDEVIDTENGDPKCVLLSGFSAGGFPMYYIGLRNPERFNMLISRAGNSSLKIFNNIELSDAAKKLPIAIYWGKDDMFTKNSGWRAFKWLRQNGVPGAEMKKVKGGHLRRPEDAYLFWLPHLPAKYKTVKE